VTGVEALMRWSHPHRGLVMPAEFIPIAESTGQIVPMGRWLLRQACLDLRRLQERAERFDLHIAVNVSARQLDDPGLVDDVSAALAASRLTPSLLTLEITESVFMSNPARSVRVVQRLKDLGVKLSIDDFGTGYSSLAYLQRLPVDELKIDRSFISDESGSTESSTLVETIVRLAQDLGLDTVAEGIETPQQFERMRDTGCRLAQGYLFARPADIRFVQQLLTTIERRPGRWGPGSPRLRAGSPDDGQFVSHPA
jgi:EAL domain-containing protein (putative c-di-GMP-specific phosphodiesterase class I)